MKCRNCLYWRGHLQPLSNFWWSLLAINNKYISQWDSISWQDILTSNRKKRVNTVQRFAWANLFAHVYFGYDILKFTIAKHTNIDMLNSKYLRQRNERWRKRHFGQTKESIRITFSVLCHIKSMFDVRETEAICWRRRERYLFCGWYDTSMCNRKEQITLGKPFLGRELKWINKKSTFLMKRSKSYAFESDSIARYI